MNMPFTITRLDAATRAWIQEESHRTGSSVEVIIERLIQRGVAAERQAARGQHFHDLDALAGTWSAEDAAEFQAALTDFEQIDPIAALRESASFREFLAQRSRSKAGSISLGDLDREIDAALDHEPM